MFHIVHITFYGYHLISRIILILDLASDCDHVLFCSVHITYISRTLYHSVSCYVRSYVVTLISTLSCHSL